MEDGRPVHKATLIRELNQNGISALSADRLRRVRGYSKFPQDFAGSAAARDEISEIIVGDWVCILVDNTVENKTCRCLVILIVEEIDGSKISGKILECFQDSDYLIWNRAHVGKKVSSTSFQSLNPEYGIEGHQVNFRAQALATAYGLLMQENKECPATASTRLPYPDIQGVQLSTVPTVKEVTDDSRSCHICTRKVTKGKLRQHIGLHIILGDVSSAVCGFCGEDKGCRSWVERTSGSGATKSLGVASDCPLFVKFSLKSAQKPTKNGPCTNRPFYCNEPPCNSASIWTYHAPAHYSEKHFGVALPDAIALKDEERQLMM